MKVCDLPGTLSSIGFLGAGVIIRDGIIIRRLPSFPSSDSQASTSPIKTSPPLSAKTPTTPPHTPRNRQQFNIPCSFSTSSEGQELPQTPYRKNMSQLMTHDVNNFSLSPIISPKSPKSPSSRSPTRRKTRSPTKNAFVYPSMKSSPKKRINQIFGDKYAPIVNKVIRNSKTPPNEIEGESYNLNRTMSTKNPGKCETQQKRKSLPSEETLKEISYNVKYFTSKYAEA